MFSILYFAKLDPDAKAPNRNHWSDAGVDFYALGDYIVKPHTIKLVKTGITIEIPNGYMGLAKPKGKNNYLLGAGVVDAGYQGEIVFKVHNTLDEDIVIRHHDPVGQIVFIPIVTPHVTEKTLANIHPKKSDRGGSGGIHTSLHKPFQVLTDEAEIEYIQIDDL